jgi:hypothetical protein
MKRPKTKAPRDKVSAKDLQLVRNFVEGLEPEQKIRLANRLSTYEKTAALDLLRRMAARVGSTTAPPIDAPHTERQGEEGKDEHLDDAPKEKKARRKKSTHAKRHGEEISEDEE